MKMRLALLVSLTVLLAGCSGAAGTDLPRPVPATQTNAAPTAGAEPTGSTEGATRTDDQGVVVFAITPLNLDSPGDTLDFEVAMDTHSVDLAWDLAALAVLRTDTGLELQATSWPVGAGHHYRAVLTFPATTAGGESILDGAAVLTLIIRDSDVPERVFVWDLQN